MTRTAVCPQPTASWGGVRGTPPGPARAGPAHPEVHEGGKAPAPTHAKGAPMPAASRAAAEGTTEEGTSSATVGKAEKEAAAQKAALTKEQHGRGRRKAE